MGKRKPIPLLENVEIKEIAAEGKAIARVDNIVVFVPFLCPGDIADIRVVRRKKKYLEGKAVKIHHYSPLRIDPFCDHFGVCGGCKWQHLPYEEQLRFKQQQVEDQLIRIGKLEIPPISPILASKDKKLYRNKLEYSFCNFRWLSEDEKDDQENIELNGLGFHMPGMFDRVLDIEKCWLQPAPSNDIRLKIKNFCVENNYTFYNARAHEGFMRNIIIRNSNNGDWMLIVSFNGNDTEKINALLSHIQNEFPEITSLLYVINDKFNDSINDLKINTFYGKDYIIDSMENLQFKIGPKSFYQTNAKQAYELYAIAREFADLKGDETVYDLYTGTGTIANFVAKRAKKVVGVEYVPEAIEDAKINSSFNKIENTVFYAGDMAKVLTPEFVEKNGKADVIITDPPRAGMHKNVIKQMLEMEAKKIVYISCNPASQARDLQLLAEKYTIIKIQPVDMFPHTHHVENIVLLEIKTTMNK